MPNAETVNDEAKLIMHRLVARRLASDPAMVARARARLDAMCGRPGEVDFVDMWRDVLGRDLASIRRALTARDERSAWLRLSSPFSTVHGLPLHEVPLRRRIWRDARRLVEMRERNAALRAGGGFSPGGGDVACLGHPDPRG